MEAANHVEFAFPQPFPITRGFTSTSGFAAHSSATEPQPKVQPLISRSYGSPGLAASPTSALNVSPSCAANVGWQALLESSKAAGISHLVGTKSMDVEPDAISPDCHMEICCTAHTTPGVRRLVKSVIRGLRAYQEPEAAVDGMGGTYFFTNDSGRKVAIFKPCDEEPLAPNNPKGYVGRALGDAGWKTTVRVGEAAMREVAAYLLDHDHFARVPHTVLARAKHPIFHYSHLKQQAVQAQSPALAALRTSEGAGGLSASFASAQNVLLNSSSGNLGDEPEEEGLPLKLGSLQEFVRHECDTTEMGCSRFSTRDVQRIAILDIRLFNTDRHSGNILVRRPSASSINLRTRLEDTQYELIPIDHGFCLPEALETPYFEWLHWPQALMPLGEEEQQYIAELDVQGDIQLLQQELPTLRHECLRVLEVSTTLLKKSAAAGLSLMEIATVMTRPLVGLGDDPSELEKMCLSARAVVDSGCQPGMQLSSSYSSGEAYLDEVEGDVLLECSQEGQDEEMAGSMGDALGWGSQAVPDSGSGQPRSQQGDEMLFDIEEGAKVMAELKPHPRPLVTIAADGPMSPCSLVSMDSLCSSTERLSLGAMLSPAPMLQAPMVAASAPNRHAIMLPGNALVWPPSSSNASSMLVSPVSPAPDTPVTTRQDSGSSADLSAAADMCGCSPNACQTKLTGSGSTSTAAAASTPAPPAQQQVVQQQQQTLTRAISAQPDALPWTSLQLPAKQSAGKRAVKSPCKKVLAAMYPPPVLSQTVPELISGIFSSYDGAMWGAFMQVLSAKMDEALRDGVWKQVTNTRTAAQSCPRF